MTTTKAFAMALLLFLVCTLLTIPVIFFGAEKIWIIAVVILYLISLHDLLNRYIVGRPKKFTVGHTYEIKSWFHHSTSDYYFVVIDDNGVANKDVIYTAEFIYFVVDETPIHVEYIPFPVKVKIARGYLKHYLSARVLN
jgi:hypothetical protein